MPRRGDTDPDASAHARCVQVGGSRCLLPLTDFVRYLQYTVNSERALFVSETTKGAQSLEALSAVFHLFHGDRPYDAARFRVVGFEIDDLEVYTALHGIPDDVSLLLKADPRIRFSVLGTS